MFGIHQQGARRDKSYKELKCSFDHELKKMRILNDPELKSVVHSGRYGVSPSLMAEMIAEGLIDPDSIVVDDAILNALRLARETRTADIPHMKGPSGYGSWRRKDDGLTTHQRINRIIQQLTNYNYELGRKELNSTMNDNEKNPMPEEKPLTVNFRGIDIHLNEEEAVKLMGDLAKEITKED